MTEKNEVDEFTGVETTGHEWDGLKELNNPAPRWWLIVMIVCIIWGVGYMVIYPAWPTLSGDGERGGTEGTMGWTQYQELEASQAEIFARRAENLRAFEAASFNDVQNDENLYAFAVAGGASAFKDNCATCHGTGGAGAPGYPNLLDDDWLWGGDINTIHDTIRYGVRSDHPDARLSEMPAFGEILSIEEVRALTSHVLSFTSDIQSTELGAQAYLDNCASCHGDEGKGVRELGAPNLADAVWFYGDKPEDIARQIGNPRHGVMPAWEARLDANTIRQLAIYVHALGGGEQE